MMNPVIDSYCGLSCADCDYRERTGCGGCIATAGNPFHGRCDVAECAKEKEVRFCGSCADFPCELLNAYSNDEEHGDNPKGARIERCRAINAALGNE